MIDETILLTSYGYLGTEGRWGWGISAIKLKEADSIEVALPLHEITWQTSLPDEGRNWGFCVGASLGFLATTVWFNLDSPCEGSFDLGCPIAAMLMTLGAGCLTGIPGAFIGNYYYQTRVARPPSDAKTRLFLELLEEKGE